MSVAYLLTATYICCASCHPAICPHLAKCESIGPSAKDYMAYHMVHFNRPNGDIPLFTQCHTVRILMMPHLLCAFGVLCSSRKQSWTKCCIDLQLPRHMLILFVAIVFSVINPLVPIMAIIYFTGSSRPFLAM